MKGGGTMNTEMLRTISRDYEMRRNQAIHDYELAINNLYSNNSELKTIDSEITALGIQATKLSLVSKGEKTDEISTILNKIDSLKNKKDIILKKNSSLIKPKYYCDKCKDTGYITDNYTTVQCSCMKQKILDLSYNSSNLNSLRESTFDKFNLTLFSNQKPNEKDISPRDNSKKLLEVAKDFVKDFNTGASPNLLFTGPSGTGKTFLSSCIANEILKKGNTVLYQTAPLLLDKIFEYKYTDNNNNKELYDNVYNVDLLIIDDLGTENTTSGRYAELFNIINSRILEQKKKTIISSNYDLKTLSEKTYDNRLISRLVGNFTICRFYGDDIRLKNRK